MILRASLAAGILAASFTAGPHAALARDLTIITRSAGTVWREIVIEPFSQASGIAALMEGGAGGPDALLAHAAEWDVVQLAARDLLVACDQGLLEKLDWATIGGRDHYIGAATTSDCGVGAAVSAIVLSWDRDKFAAAPSWSDFWDIAKYPGKRGLHRGAAGNLEFALIADGVAPGDVYRTLRSDDGIERAFRKLDQLKPYVVWWQTAPSLGPALGTAPGAADAARILGSGEVLMTSAPNTQIFAANHEGARNFGIQWAGAMMQVQSWTILKGTANLTSAQKFLAFAGDPKIEGRLPAAAGLGGLAKGANDGLPTDQSVLSPSLPANFAAGFVMDAAFWRDNADKLDHRFEGWLAH